MADYIRREDALEAFENADADVYEDYGDGTVDWGFGRKNIQMKSRITIFCILIR